MDRSESRHYLWCSTESCREHSLSRAPAAGSAEKDAAIILSVRLKGQDLQEMTLRTSQKSQARISALSKKRRAEFLHRALGFRQKPGIKSCPECEVVCRGKAGGTAWTWGAPAVLHWLVQPPSWRRRSSLDSPGQTQAPHPSSSLCCSWREQLPDLLQLELLNIALSYEAREWQTVIPSLLWVAISSAKNIKDGSSHSLQISLFYKSLFVVKRRLLSIPSKEKQWRRQKKEG